MLFKLLTLPLSAPLDGLRFVLGQIGEMAEREFYDVDRIRENLLLLQLRLEEGEITEEEYAVEEAEIMARLRAARAYQRGLRTEE